MRLRTYELNYDLQSNKTVLDYSLKALNDLELDYVAYENGISQIFSSPIGMEALEYKSEKELRSYGWCFFSLQIVAYRQKMQMKY